MNLQSIIELVFIGGLIYLIAGLVVFGLAMLVIAKVMKNMFKD